MKLTGEATIPKIAERAIIDLEVSSSNKSHQTAATNVTETAKTLQKLLKQYSPTATSTAEEKATAAIPKWSMGKMKTSSFVYNPSNSSMYYNNHHISDPLPLDRPTKIHTATVHFNIRVRDFTKLGMLNHTFSQMEHVKIERTSWILTAQTRKAYRSELRRLAAKDALDRARDYAETLGLKTVRPIELTEQGYTDGAWNPYSAMRRAIGQPQQMQMQQQMQIQAPMGGGGGAADDEGVDLFFEPDEIQLSMSVDCKFAAE